MAVDPKEAKSSFTFPLEAKQVPLIFRLVGVHDTFRHMPSVIIQTSHQQWAAVREKRNSSFSTRVQILCFILRLLNSLWQEQLIPTVSLQDSFHKDLVYEVPSSLHPQSLLKTKFSKLGMIMHFHQHLYVAGNFS